MKTKSMYLLLIRTIIFERKWNIRNGCRNFMDRFIQIQKIILRINL